MTAPCTFGTTTVPSRAVRYMKIIGSYEFEAELECATKTFSEYTALAALAGPCTPTQLLSGKVKVQTTGGTKASLVLNGATYTNCYITEISTAEADGMQLKLWIFTIKFVKETV
ncbi:TPA_asm: hypothetical protein vir524_00038 [Caudoviricetes sp. vir524]|jgi:hypothetical protein|nr:TPA_asm: hypothetical protein vir524_00038 [Caudoviricetes sp. vir524]